jgi:invasion protein IalB
MKTIGFRFAGIVAGLAALAFLVAPAAGAKPAEKPAEKPAASAALPAKAKQPLKPSETKGFGDWSVNCYPVSSPSPCEMIEVLVNKKTRRRVLGVMVVYIPSRDQHIIQVSVPLGVMLQNGAVLTSDTFTSKVLRYRICDFQGCYVVMPIDNNAIKALGRATKAGMQIVSVDGKKYKLNFSLKGFAAAHDALVEMARQKATSAPANAAPAEPAPAEEGN